MLLWYNELKLWFCWSLWVCPGTTWLCNSIDCSPPGSTVHGILQVRILEWITMPFFRGSSQPRDWTWVSCIAGRFFTIWASWKAYYMAAVSYYLKFLCVTLSLWPSFHCFWEYLSLISPSLPNPHLLRLRKADNSVAWIFYISEKNSYFYDMQMQPKFWSQNCWVQERLLKAESLDKHLLSAVELLRMGSR